MDSSLKQRLVGAIVLVALAVIFLPMLIQGPAPESGAADVPLDVEAQPADGFETRDIPLVTPGRAPAGGALGMDRAPGGGGLATVDTADADRDAGASDPIRETPLDDGGTGDPDPAAVPEPRDDGEMFPPPTAGGDYAVSFGSFSSAAAAEAIVGSLRASQLPGYRERARVNGFEVHRVRIGPYASRAEAEAARLRAAHVRDDVGSEVIALDGGAVDAPAPATPATPPPTPAPTPPPAADTGFAVQLGAFREAADVEALRARVRAAGFDTFTEQVRTDQGPLTRLLVGPVMSRADAERLQAQLKARFGIDGLVRSHP